MAAPPAAAANPFISAAEGAGPSRRAPPVPPKLPGLDLELQSAMHDAASSPLLLDEEYTQVSRFSDDGDTTCPRAVSPSFYSDDASGEASRASTGPSIRSTTGGIRPPPPPPRKVSSGPRDANFRVSGMLLGANSNTSLGRHGSEPIQGYLNIAAHRNDVTRTFSLPPSSLKTLSSTSLAHILELDIPISRSRWDPETRSGRAARTRRGSWQSLRTVGERIMLAAQPAEVWIAYQPRIAGAAGAKPRHPRWLRLDDFALAEPTLQSAVLERYLRSYITVEEEPEWLSLMIREASEGAPPASDDRGPTGMQRVGKGLSRLSLGVASLFGALDVLDGGERSEARRRAELEELGFVEIEGAQGSESNAAPPRSPSPFARRLGGFRRNKPAKQGGFVGMCRSIIDRALGAENPSNMMAPREQVDDLEADAQPLTGSAVAELARARPEISAPLPAAAASPQTKRRKESGADNNRSEGTKEPFQRLRRAFSTKDKENSPLLKPGLGLQPTVVDGYGAVVQGGGWPTGKLAASGSKKKRKEERADTFWRPRGEAAPESMTSSSDSQEAERIRNLGRRWASPPPEGQVRESKVLRERLDLNAESLRQTLPLPPLNDSAAVAVPRPGGASVRTTSEHSARVPQARLTMADVPMSCQSITDVPAGSSAAGHGQDDADSSDDGNYLEPGSRDDERRDSAATARPMSHSKTSESIVTSDARDGLVIRAPSASPSLSRAHQLVSDTSLSSSPGKAKRSKPSSWRRFGRSNNGDADTGASSSDENQLPTPRRRSFSLTRPASRGADSAPMRPGGAQIIARPADAGIAVFSGAR